MLSKLYNGGVNTLKFIAAILGMLKDPKKVGAGIGMTGLLFASMQYVIAQVDKKHTIAMQKVEKTNEKVAALTSQQAAILSTLQAIQKVGERTEQRLWEVSRDIQSMKGKEN